MIGVIVLTVLAFIMGVVIVYVDSKFKYNEDDKCKKVLELLPNFNCGGCGLVNCSNMAQEALKNKDIILKCRPLKNKDSVLKKIENIINE